MALGALVAMQVTAKKLSAVLVEFDVEIAADRVKSELDRAYEAVAKNAKVRGFRPGKAPRKVLSHMFGSRIVADVTRRLVDETFPQAVSEQKLQPVSKPAIEPQRLSENAPFSYKARFEVVPEIQTVHYAGLRATRPKVVVTDERVEEELAKLRRSQATLEPAGSRPSVAGDVAIIDFSVEVGSEAVPEAGATDFSVELGMRTVFPAIDAALQGKKAGEHVDVEVDIPPSHPHPKLRGKKATFHLTLKELKERVLPEADDEFAKDLGEFETLAELRAQLREDVARSVKEEGEQALAEQLVVELVKANEVPLPPTLVEQQMRVTEQEILGRARMQGSQVTGLGDELREQIRRDSEVKVRAGLLMAEIAKKEGIQIGEAEIEEGLKELSEQTGKNISKLRAEYREPKQREMLIGMILEHKVLDIIESKAQIEEIDEAPGLSPNAGQPETKQAGKQKAGKQTAGKQEAGKQEAGKQEAGKQEAGKQEAGKQEAGKPPETGPELKSESNP